MTSTGDRLLGRRSFCVRELCDHHPAVIRNGNKQVVFQLARGGIGRSSEELVVSRWRVVGLPAMFPPCAPPTLEQADGFFTYPPPAAGQVEWHLNFADPHLFVAHGGPLLAQDELQVAEHPALAHLLEALRSRPVEGLAPLTRERGQSTPVLIRGVERCCEIATAPGPGRPGGLYGNRFAAAPPSVVRDATCVLEPPSVSNILAISAPRPGSGWYSREEIEDILVTALSGFVAARQESPGARVAIHTGHWGCGAFGGNRTLTVVLQIAAARLAGVSRLVYHLGDSAGHAAYEQGRCVFDALAASHGETRAFLDAVEAKRYEWGVPDGN